MHELLKTVSDLNVFSIELVVAHIICFRKLVHSVRIEKKNCRCILDKLDICTNLIYSRSLEEFKTCHRLWRAHNIPFNLLFDV